MLFMTWGYRDGDSLNSFNNNFTNMQTRLTEGYTRYAENISNAGNSVWIAPWDWLTKPSTTPLLPTGTTPPLRQPVLRPLHLRWKPPFPLRLLSRSVVFHSSTTGETCGKQRHGELERKCETNPSAGR